MCDNSGIKSHAHPKTIGLDTLFPNVLRTQFQVNVFPVLYPRTDNVAWQITRRRGLFTRGGYKSGEWMNKKQVKKGTNNTRSLIRNFLTLRGVRVSFFSQILRQNVP